MRKGATYWREKWLEARRYLRAANRGAENNSRALQLLAIRHNDQSRRNQELRVEMQKLREEIRELKRPKNAKEQTP